VSGSIRIRADLARLADVRAHVREAARMLGADDRAVDDLVQTVDEWVTNVIVHGYRGGDGPIDVTVERSGEQVVVAVTDRAPLFDPRSAPAFDPTVPLERRRLGGMGIHLMRELMDQVDHRPAAGGGNVVAMWRTVRTIREEERQ
jgi:serine/threonine-protein kinase RsbW